MKLSQLLLKCGIPLTKMMESDPEITHLSLNSNEIKKGTLFIAIKGFVSDGHDFCEEAEKNGAAAIMGTRKSVKVSVPYFRVKDSRQVMSNLAAVLYDSRTHLDKMKIIGITGTNGKTSTTFYTRYLLEKAGISTGLIGTIQYIIGGQTRQAPRTTPEAIDLHRYVAEMAHSGDQALVMEVSSHAIGLHRVDDIRYDVAAFTNLSAEHLDFHGDMESYFKTKKVLFTDLLKKDGQAVINIDDSYGERLCRDLNKIIKVTEKSDGDWVYSITSTIPEGIHFTLSSRFGESNLFAPVMGKYNIENLVMALAIASAVFPQYFPVFIASIDRIPQIKGRLQRISNNIFVDYSHTPDALEKALSALNFPGRKITLVFGAGGNRDKQKRPLMGQIAEKYADKIYVTNDNPRLEDPLSIAKDILEGFEHPSTATIELDRKKAISDALAAQNDEDIVLIAGKGHESYQEIGKQKYPFNDAEIVKKILEH